MDVYELDSRITDTPNGKIFHVTGNARSAAEAIHRLNCKENGWARKPEKLELVIQPVDEKVRPVTLEQLRKTNSPHGSWVYDSIQELYERYPNMVSPMSAIYFGTLFRGEQAKWRHFTIWLNARGEFCKLDLTVDDHNNRWVTVGQFHAGLRLDYRDYLLLRE